VFSLFRTERARALSEKQALRLLNPEAIQEHTQSAWEAYVAKCILDGVPAMQRHNFDYQNMQQLVDEAHADPQKEAELKHYISHRCALGEESSSVQSKAPEVLQE
jgi:hypothetical protein